ncbi:MAG TPA: TolC family protein [Thermoanaerobaculia bacterium]|nr:TolC family protein [Thermoanaerobaculia bacterium]
MKRTVLCSVLILAVTAPAHAQETVRLTLAEALERARQSSPRLAELDDLKRAAAARLRGAEAEKRPEVDLQASYFRNSDVPEFSLSLPGAGTRTIFPNIPDNYRLHAGASLPLYTGGRIEGAIEAAGREREAAGQDRAGGERDLVLETTLAYWSLVTARESARVLAESIASYEAHLKDARNRFDVGVAASNEVLTVQVERDRAELGRLQAENGAEVANANLARILGLPPSTRIETTEPMTAPAGEPEDEEALAAAALDARPELLALRERIASARASALVRRAATRPQVGLSLGYDYANPNTRIFPLRDEFEATWTAGVTLGFNAWDGGRTAAAVEEAEARASALERRLEDTERRLRLDVASRLADLRTARAALEVSQRNLEAARENLRVAQDRYREGVIPSSDLLDAETLLLRAGLDQTDAAARIRVALANLDRAVGR